MTRPVRDNPQFYLTAPSPCPYLPGKEERKVFTHLVGKRGRELNDILTQGRLSPFADDCLPAGLRSCQACLSVRVVVDDFVEIAQQPAGAGAQCRPDRHRNANIATSEHYALFRNYIETRHGDGGMAQMSMLDVKMMIEDSHVETRLIEYRLRDPDSGFTGQSTGRLVGMALTDVMSDGLSMVYSVYDPDETSRSLGTYMILDHLRRARTTACRLCISATGSVAPQDGLQGAFQAAGTAVVVRWERVEG